MRDSVDLDQASIRSIRRIGFRGCLDEAVRQLLPALVFPKIYREFLRQECDAAHFARSEEGRLLLGWIGWKADCYLGALESDDQAIDGPLGPQQLFRELAAPLKLAFPEREREIGVRILRKILDALGIPKEEDEVAARRMMLADAEEQLASPIPPLGIACMPVVRALADFTAAELGVVIPWREGSESGLGIESPDAAPGLVRPDGMLVLPRQDRFDMTHPAALAGDMLEHMCWGPCFGTTHVSVRSFFESAARGYLEKRRHLRDRARGVVSSLQAVQLHWNERHISTAEGALRGRRVPFQILQAKMHGGALLQIMRGVSRWVPEDGWRSFPLQEIARREVRAVSERKRISWERSAREVLESHLVEWALFWPEWRVLLDGERSDVREGIVAAVQRRLEDSDGVAVSCPIATFVEAEGLPSLSLLKAPAWASHLCEEAYRQYQDAESAFIERLGWKPTPRITEAPQGWATSLSGYARAVESELVFDVFDPALARFEGDREKWPDDRLRMIRDGRRAGRRSIGARFARFVLSRRAAGSAEGARVPCLGEMHFLLSLRLHGLEDDPGAELMRGLRSEVTGPRWELGVRRNTTILEGINRYRVDSAHPRRADSEREVGRDQAVLGRRIMVQYLQFLVELKREGNGAVGH